MLLVGCARGPKGIGKPGEMKPPRVKAEGKKGPKQVLASTNTINSVRPDGDVVWFCTDGGVVRYDKPTDSYLRFTKEDGLLANLTWAAAQQGDDLWVGGMGGVSRLNVKSGAVQTWQTLEGARIFLVSHVLATSAGSASILVEDNGEWSGFAPEGLYRFDPSNQTWAHQGALEGGERSQTHALLPEEAELAQQARADQKLIESISTSDKPFSDCTAVAAKGTATWAGSPEGLFYRPEPASSWQQTAYEGYLDISALAFDGETLWVGTREAGAFIFNPQKKQTRAFGLPTDLPSNRVLDLVARDDALWAAYDGGICRLPFPSLEAEPLSEKTEYPVSEVQCLAAANDYIYFAAPSHGVYAIDPTASEFATISDLAALKVSQAKDLVLAGGQLWLSTERGVIRIDLGTSRPSLFPTDLFLDLQEWEQLPLQPVSEGSILIARGDQVFRLDPESGNYSIEISVDSGRGISDLWFAPSSSPGLGETTLYIATQGGGIYSHPLGTRVATVVKGVGQFISDLTGDSRTLWIANSEYEGTTVGLQTLNLQTGTVHTSTLQDGLPSEDILALALHSDQLWVATSGGICRLPGS